MKSFVPCSSVQDRLPRFPSRYSSYLPRIIILLQNPLQYRYQDNHTQDRWGRTRHEILNQKKVLGNSRAHLGWVSASHTFWLYCTMATEYNNIQCLARPPYVTSLSSFSLVPKRTAINFSLRSLIQRRWNDQTLLQKI